MSQENVELHRRAVEAFNTRDVEKFIALCDPEIELHSAVTVPGGAIYYGPTGCGGGIETSRMLLETRFAWSPRPISTSASRRLRSTFSTAVDGTAAYTSRSHSLICTGGAQA
jgi:hypothetical protein